MAIIYLSGYKLASFCCLPWVWGMSDEQERGRDEFLKNSYFGYSSKKGQGVRKWLITTYPVLWGHFPSYSMIL